MSKRPISPSAGTQTTLESWRTKKPRVEAAEVSGAEKPPSPLGSLDLTKILSWNIDTPVPFLDLPAKKLGSSATSATPRPRHLRELLAQHGFPDFLCLQEVRARPSDADWLAALTAAVNGRGRDGGPRYTAHIALNRAPRGPRHFGVATFAREPGAVAAAREVAWDAEGRVVVLELRAGWALVNVYALNGSEHPWRAPAGAGVVPQTRNERKREFNRLLLREVRAMQARGLRVVLVGDFNISLTAKDCFPRLRTEYPHALARKEFNETFIPGANVVDVFREKHGDEKRFSWFAKGRPQGSDCARVDYALVERTQVDRVVEIEYMDDPKERAHSDHAPLLLVMKDMGKLDTANSGPHGSAEGRQG
ncbi:DNase I-like protein [Phanerochaete sordida]|uniref:DNase I-like protein n=1 Tax=Phanerochaete sordida TaxID=48140 RepID=A0A9P3LAI2_9APHY|nr:DNase I-like protein [Phanerochaete sordida]